MKTEAQTIRELIDTGDTGGAVDAAAAHLAAQRAKADRILATLDACHRAEAGAFSVRGPPGRSGRSPGTPLSEAGAGAEPVSGTRPLPLQRRAGPLRSSARTGTLGGVPAGLPRGRDQAGRAARHHPAGGGGRTLLVQPATGRDVTEEIETFAGGFVSGAEDVDGFILKSRSPSCGPGGRDFGDFAPRSWAVRFEAEYILDQAVFAPFPEALVSQADSGRGRVGRAP